MIYITSHLLPTFFVNPWIFRSQDVIGVAKTGSGKTLGYLLPGDSSCPAGSHRKTIGKCWFYGFWNGDLPSGNDLQFANWKMAIDR